MSVDTFLAMGGYGAVIWPSYGLAAIFVISIAVHSIMRMRAIKKQLNHQSQNRSDD